MVPRSAPTHFPLEHAYIGYMFNNLTPVRTATCRTCGQTARKWRWTRKLIVAILKTEHSCMPGAWLLFPNFTFWTQSQPQDPGTYGAVWTQPGHRASLRILGHMVQYGHTVHYIPHARRKPTLVDYTEFLKRSRCKSTHGHNASRPIAVLSSRKEAYMRQATTVLHRDANALRLPVTACYCDSRCQVCVHRCGLYSGNYRFWGTVTDHTCTATYH